MNNEEALIKDLISTKHKGVEEQRFIKDLPILLAPVQLSRRSSLRSFFADPGVLDSIFKDSLKTSLVLDKLPVEHLQADEVETSSAVVSSVLDSGVYSHGFIENQEKVEDQNTASTMQVIENCQRIETSV